MAYLAEDHGVWMARAAGAAAGASLSLIYMLPRGVREAAVRFLTGVVAGLVFGGPAGLYLAERLAVGDQLSGIEIAMSGSTLVSLTAWWALGAMKRLAEKTGR